MANKTECSILIYLSGLTGRTSNEALFCEEFLQERRIIFANGAFFHTRWSGDTRSPSLRGEIYDSKPGLCRETTFPGRSPTFWRC